MGGSMRAAAMRRMRLPRLGAGPQIIAVLLVLGLFGAMAIEPTRQLMEQRDRIAGMAHELGKVERSNRRLEARIKRLRDPDFIEQRAREQVGLVRPGEVTYVVMPPTRAHSANRKHARAERPAALPEPGFLEGLVHFIGLR
jgi:cell division protein FtsB